MRDAEERAVLVVPEARAHLFGEALAVEEPGLVGGRFVERDAAVGERGVVLEEGLHRGAAAGVDAQQCAVVGVHVVEDEGCRALGCGDESRLAKLRAGLREGVDREAVPGGDHFGIGGRRDAASAADEQGLTAALQRCVQVLFRDVQPASDRSGLVDDVEDGLALEVAADVDAPIAARALGVGGWQQLEELVAGPDEVFSLDALGVGVGRGEERAVGRLEAAEQVVAGLSGDAAEELVAGQPPGGQVERDQQRRCRRASSRSAGRARLWSTE